MAVTIACTACGQTYEVDEGRIPPGGAKIRCRLSQAVFLATRAAPPPDAKPAAPRESGWAVRTAEGEQEDLGLPELKEMVRAERVLETDSVRIPETDQWIVAGRVPELQRYFRIKARVTGGAPTLTQTLAALACSTHREREAIWACPRCNTAFCELCVVQKQVQMQRIPWCEKCGDRVIEIPRERQVKPFWLDLGRIIAYPLHPKGLVPFIAYAVIAAAAALIGLMPGLGWSLSWVLRLYIFGYTLHLIKESAGGKEYPPEFPEMSDVFSDMALPAIKMVLVTGISFLPMLLWIFFLNRLLPTPAWLIGILVLFLVGLVFYPMVLAILAIWGGLFASLNPVLLARLIGRIIKEYIIFLLFWYAGWVVVLIAEGVVWRFPLGSAVAALIHSYFFFVMGHMLGRMCYQCEDRLAWT